MKLILENAIINMDLIVAVYMEDGALKLDYISNAYIVTGVPSNALQQIAIALAEGKSYLEFEAAHLPMEEEQ